MTEAGPAPPPDDELVPGWLQRLAAVGWRLLAAIILGLVLIYIAVQLATVTASIVIAAIVAATFAPYVLTLRQRGWSRIKAAAAVFLGAAFVIIATFVIIAIAFVPYVGSVVDAFSAGLAALKTSMAGLQIPPEAGDAIERAAKALEVWLSAAAAGIVADVGALATVAILATFLTFFFMMDGDKAWMWVLSSANTWRRDAITTSGHVALERVGGYLRGTAVIAAVDAVAEGLFLVILGVPLAAPLAVIVFFGRFIPYIGGLDHDAPAAAGDPGHRGHDRRPDPPRPDHYPQRHPGQVPGPGHLPEDRRHPSCPRTDRSPRWRGAGRDRRPFRGDPGRRLRPRGRRGSRASPRGRTDRGAVRQARSSRSGWNGSVS